jgi:hypothetical protein
MRFIGRKPPHVGPRSEDDIVRSDLDCCISVKPSQVGLDVGPDVFRRNPGDIAAHAGRRGAFVRVDTTPPSATSSPTTTAWGSARRPT